MLRDLDILCQLLYFIGKSTSTMMVLYWIFFTINVLTIHGLTSDNFPDCKSGPLATFPICNVSLSSRQRTTDLVARMTIAEKITQLATTAAAVPRLGLPKFEWWSEALHGVAYSPGVSFGGDLPAASSFPMPINLGASFNMSLVYRIASTISTEARAFNNEGRAGLVFFTPNINIFRDPRWGRGQETPGEDPFLTSQYVYALINGLQRGDDERYLKTAADCKHFDAYDLEDWNGTDRFHFDARVTDQDLVETYLPPFESCVRDAKVASIMCSYNSINGVPACANRFLIEMIAR
jgi:xylan 1,4-beta-xylosidase